MAGAPVLVIVIHCIGGADRDSEYDTTYTLPVLYSRLGIYPRSAERLFSLAPGAGGSRRIQCSVQYRLSGACCEALCCRVSRGALAVGALDTCVHFLSSVTNSSLKGCRPSLPLGR